MNTFKFTNNLKNKDIYLFIICNNLKKNILEIQNMLNIKAIPKKILDTNTIPINDYERTLYTDQFAVQFYIMGKNNKCDNIKLYEIFGKLGKESSNIFNKKILINIEGDNENIIKNQIVSYILGFYNFNDFKTEKHINKLKTFFYHKKRKFKKIIENSIYEGIVQNEIRSLINTPANILNSTVYASYIKKNMNPEVKIKILNKEQLEKIGCNLILGVNQGSKNKPMLVILEYKYKNTDKPIALIGKGVMFDSGGYNLKSGNFGDMKNDMTGSAIVFAIFKLLSKFKISGHFIGLLPLVENMIDANAIRPGDILTAYNGKTVEITDTDAEGRLIMADALAYSIKYKPYMCIDIATLTGQAAAIFDNKSSVIMGNNNKYIQKMIKAGTDNNEKIWELPMWKEYIDLTVSNIADFRNYTYEAKAGTIMAGAFLSNFIPKDTNWLHLDIAGVDNLKFNSHIRHYGASGEIVRSLFAFLQNFEKESYEK